MLLVKGLRDETNNGHTKKQNLAETSNHHISFHGSHRLCGPGETIDPYLYRTPLRILVRYSCVGAGADPVNGKISLVDP